MSVSTFDPSASTITLTEAAKQHFATLLSKQPGKMVRLSTKVSGCTGYAYVLDTVDTITEGDEVIPFGDDMTFLVAGEAKNLVQMTQIDFVKEGINGVIKFNNPNVTNECGCGESFSVN